MGFTPSVCPYCSCGCGMLLETRGGRLTGTHPDVHHPASRGSLCMRGWNAAMAPGHRDRIPAPLVREQGGLVPASAARAVGAVADAMRRLRGRADASVLFCVGPACTNEDAYAVRKLARESGARACPTDLIGLPAARRAIRGVFGRSYLPGGLDALAAADLIWAFGADPGACPQAASRMSEAMRQGAAVVHFDLFAAAGDDAHRTHVFIPPDRFALLPPLLQKAAFESDRIPDAVRAVPTFAALADFWRHGRGSALPEHPWLPDARLQELVSAFLDARNPAAVIGERFLSAAGAGEATLQLVQALVLLSAGERIVCMTGEANSWGTWDAVGPGKGDTDAMLDLLDPAGTGKFDAVFVIGDDLMRRGALKLRLAERLSENGLVVLIDSFHSEMEACAHVVLPSVTFAERDGTLTSMFGLVQRWRPALAPFGESASACAWISRIAGQLGIEGWPGSEAAWFAEMRSGTPPYGTAALDRLYAGTGGYGAALEEEAGLTLAPPAFAGSRSAPNGLPLQYCFGTHPALWSTGRLSKREEILRREVNQSVLHVSPADMAAYGLNSGSAVRVKSSRAEAVLTVQQDTRLPAGVLLAFPVPGSAARKLCGFFPETDSQTIGIQPISVSLERI